MSIKTRLQKLEATKAQAATWREFVESDLSLEQWARSMDCLAEALEFEGTREELAKELQALEDDN